jgi:hypothetical protein
VGASDPAKACIFRPLGSAGHPANTGLCGSNFPSADGIPAPPYPAASPPSNAHCGPWNAPTSRTSPCWSPWPLGSTVSGPAGSHSAASSPPTAAHPGTVGATPSSAAGTTASLVLEGPPAATIRTAFALKNHTEQSVTARVVHSDFRSAAGHQVRPPIEIHPAQMTLAPGEQATVQLTAVLPPELALNTSYLGEMSIEGLPGTQVSVLLRAVAPAPTTSSTP